MPGFGLKANPVEMKKLALGIMKDLKEFEDKTAFMWSEYKKLGESFQDDGYLEMGSYIQDIQKRIDERGEYIKLASGTIDKAADEIMKALEEQAKAILAAQQAAGGQGGRK